MDELIERYRTLRARSETLCAPLEVEDYCIQAMENVSPPKWHLAHVTWFFEMFILVPYAKDYRMLREEYAHLFNSYYETAGTFFPRPQRGMLSRPTVQEVYDYRHHVDGALLDLLSDAAQRLGRVEEGAGVELLTALGFDLGGSGSDMRTPSCCCGPARCEFACYDTLALTYDLTQTFQDEMHRPAFPYKFKFKMAGCGNDCVASIARADLSIIGTWRDEIKIDQAEVKKYVGGGLDIAQDVMMNCPTKCISWDGKTFSVDDENCVKCMHCINVMPKALRPGDDRGATLLLGSKAPIVEGALLSSVLVPFIKLEPPYTELKELIENIWEIWSEHGKNRERVGEFIQRVGLGNFLEEIGLEPIPQMVKHPRENPYIFFEEYATEDEEA